jgi:CheY-like chemotaxis protein/two-component sensor histidine kinase
VLDLARLDAGRMVLHPMPVDLPALLRQIVDNHRLAAESHGLQLALSVDADLPRHVSLDGLRLRQLLVNLIGNAIKYTTRGEVQVFAQRGVSQPPESAVERLVLVVRDTGIGIAAELQHALFEPFETLHSPLDAPAEGSTGLGLAICKRLVEAMGGQIRLDSAVGRGTEVTVDLPMPPPAEWPEPSEPPTVAPVPSGQVVLLVDDDGVSRMLMAETLRADGYAVAEATGVQAALARWQQGGVALVISDHQMPDGTGLEMLSQMAKAAGPTGAVRARLVLCSGSLPELDLGATGIDAVLRKPVTREVLRRTLRQWLPATG